MIHCNKRMTVRAVGAPIPEYYSEDDDKPFRIFTADVFECTQCKISIIGKLSKRVEYPGSVGFIMELERYDVRYDRAFQSECKIVN